MYVPPRMNPENHRTIRYSLGDTLLMPAAQKKARFESGTYTRDTGISVRRIYGRNCAIHIPVLQPHQPICPKAESRGEKAQPAAQPFTGTTSKEADSYVLKVSDTSSYKLDDQDQAKQYEGQRVRVIGNLDMRTNLIKVQRIEPLS